jgi:hypothetical protein
MNAMPRILLDIVIEHLRHRQYVIIAAHITIPLHSTQLVVDYTYLTIQDPALPDLRQVLRNNTLLRIKCQLSIRAPSAIQSLQELANRLFIIDALLHFARSKMQLIPKLWQWAFCELLSGEVLLVRRGVGCCGT